MPSPIAHSMIGLTLGLIRFLPHYRRRDELANQFRTLWRPLLFCILMANAPDLDYFFGIFRGNANYYHQTVTHTVIWISVTALAIWIYGWLRKQRAVFGPPSCAKEQGDSLRGASLGLLLALMGSHLLADGLTVDHSPPVGLMLFWPFSDRFYHAAFAFFPPPAKQTLADVFSLQNLRLILVELAITLPLVVIVLWFKRRQTSR